MTDQGSKAYYNVLHEVFPIERRFPVGRLGFWNFVEMSLILYGYLRRRVGYGGAFLLTPPDDYDALLRARLQKDIIGKRQRRVQVRGEQADYWVLRVPRHPLGRLDMEFASGPRLLVAHNYEGYVALASCYLAEGGFDRAIWLLLVNTALMGGLFLVFFLTFVMFALNALNPSWVPHMQPAGESYWPPFLFLLLVSLMSWGWLYRHLDAIHARVFRKEEIWERRLPRVTEEMHRMKEELVALGWRVVPEEEWDDYLMADEAEQKSEAAQE